jgi:serine-type D-Ala-D-Ala carboxypeptidase/endopeptidase (penicillin-binding protein 4)
MNFRVLIILFATLSVGCSSIKKSILEIGDDYKYHPGFYLYDPGEKKELISLNEDKYFTAGSNTKVYTFYATLQVLGDSIPAFRYVETDTALFIWGMADPSFLNYKLPQGKSYSFLSKAPKIYLSTTNFNSARFGAGWSWDDYNGNYSQELTSFPIYGNSVYFNIDSLSKALQINPSIFRDSVEISENSTYGVTRKEFNNQFEWHTSNCKDCELIRPIYFSKNTVAQLLSDTLNIPVNLIDKPLPQSAQTFYSIPSDSVLKVMMQESDNFMAEHLLLLCSGLLTDTLSTKIGIREFSTKINEIVPDKLVWKDGSGLSRYNLFTPRSMVFLWHRIYQDIGEERLFSLLAVGGKTGTLENWFGADTPYVYAKTGTLSNIFNLSGFIITKSGKRLIFSYMNNNYPVSSSDIKKEMEVVLKKAYEKY